MNWSKSITLNIGVSLHKILNEISISMGRIHGIFVWYLIYNWFSLGYHLTDCRIQIPTCTKISTPYSRLIPKKWHWKTFMLWHSFPIKGILLKFVLHFGLTRVMAGKDASGACYESCSSALAKVEKDLIILTWESIKVIERDNLRMQTCTTKET